MQWLALFVVLCGCDMVFGLKENPVPSDGDAGRIARKITITQSTGSTLVDFPVSIIVTEDVDLARRARTNGSDIRYTDLDGNLLPHEIVTYSAGTLEAWVRVTLGSTTEILLVYGDEPSFGLATDTWSDAFAAVWHLAEVTPEVTSARDSTRGGLTLLPVTAAPETAVGVIGSARKYAETPELQRLCAPLPRVIDMADRSFSFSAWINAEPLVGTFSQPFAAGGHSSGAGGFAFELTSNSLLAFVSDTDAASRSFLALGFSARPINRWAHIAAVVDRPNQQLRAYLDGDTPTSRSLTDLEGDQLNLVVTEDRVCIGGPSGFAGIVDEVRIYTLPITRAWIDAEIRNATDRANFVRIDPPPN